MQILHFILILFGIFVVFPFVVFLVFVSLPEMFAGFNVKGYLIGLSIIFLFTIVFGIAKGFRDFKKQSYNK